jgi:hypothetical protein
VPGITAHLQTDTELTPHMPTPHPLPGWVAATIVAAELSIVAVLPRVGEDAGDGDTVAKPGLQLT